jgi:hypothetical protein
VARRSELITEHGKTSIADSVVAKIAGLATREVSGVHEMGGGTSRAFGAIKDRDHQQRELLGHPGRFGGGGRSRSRSGEPRCTSYQQ